MARVYRQVIGCFMGSVSMGSDRAEAGIAAKANEAKAATAKGHAKAKRVADHGPVQ